MNTTENQVAIDSFIEWIEEISSLINSDKWNGEDVMAIFFNEFNRYKGKSERGQVFTPDHITSFMYRLLEVNQSDIILDAACGAMITEIDFKVKGEEQKKLVYAIGELLEMLVKYTRTLKFDYRIGSSVLDKNGAFHTSEDLSKSKLELVLERFLQRRAYTTISTAGGGCRR